MNTEMTGLLQSFQQLLTEFSEESLSDISLEQLDTLSNTIADSMQGLQLMATWVSDLRDQKVRLEKTLEQERQKRVTMMANWAEQLKGLANGLKVCEECNLPKDDVKFAPDPYDSEIDDDDTPYWLCQDCREESAANI